MLFITKNEILFKVVNNGPSYCIYQYFTVDTLDKFSHFSFAFNFGVWKFTWAVPVPFFWLFLSLGSHFGDVCNM